MDSESSKKIRITNRSIREKYMAIKDVQNGMAKSDVYAKYNVKHNTLSGWLKSKDSIIEGYEKLSSGG